MPPTRPLVCLIQYKDDFYVNAKNYQEIDEKFGLYVSNLRCLEIKYRESWFYVGIYINSSCYSRFFLCP